MKEASTFAAFLVILRRDLTLALRNRSELANPLFFFIIAASLFPLGIGPESEILAAIAPGIIWVCALLAAMLSLDSIFRSDFDDGALEQFLMCPHPFSVLVTAKVLAHWLVTGVPLILLAPLLGVLLHLPSTAIGTLVLTLALGTPVLSFVGAIGVALTVGLKRGGMLMSLLILPLYVPILIFGAGAVDAVAAGFDIKGHLLLMCAVLVLAVSMAPLATAAALRVSSG